MSSLVDTLVESGIIDSDTVVTARIPMQTRWGGIEYKYGDYLFQKSGEVPDSLTLKEIYGTKIINTKSEDIVSIEGMTLARFADVCNINVDGSLKPSQRKRGRKPKIRS